MTTLEENLKKCPNLILGKAGCPFCVEAIKIFMNKLVNFIYIAKEKDDEMVNEIKEKYQHVTFPAVFFDGKFVGGCDSLKKFKW